MLCFIIIISFIMMYLAPLLLAITFSVVIILPLIPVIRAQCQQHDIWGLTIVFKIFQCLPEPFLITGDVSHSSHHHSSVQSVAAHNGKLRLYLSEFHCYLFGLLGNN